jgi:hypothetical protein
MIKIIENFDEIVKLMFLFFVVAIIYSLNLIAFGSVRKKIWRHILPYVLSLALITCGMFLRPNNWLPFFYLLPTLAIVHLLIVRSRGS